MATQKQDPLDVLQQTINDIVSFHTQDYRESSSLANCSDQLVQTGKALKAAQSQGPRNIEQVRSILSARMNESVESYHRALEEIEIEIVRFILVRGLFLFDC